MKDLLTKIEPLLQRLELLLPPIPSKINWDTNLAASWQSHQKRGFMQPLRINLDLRLSDLVSIEKQVQILQANTRQFLQGLPANHALLWGSRGTGKSSLVRAILAEYANQGLRFIEVERDFLADFPQIINAISNLPQKFLLFCDDLSFEAGEGDYRILKSVLDGSLAQAPDNLLLYATSNRRHLVPEKQADNANWQLIEGEVHPSEAVEDKIALSDRFGLHLSFYPFSQEQYLQAVSHWLNFFWQKYNSSFVNLTNHNWQLNQELTLKAIQFATNRGNRNGRCAFQFAKNWAGLQLLELKD